MIIPVRIGKLFKIIKKNGCTLQREYFALLVKYNVEENSKVVTLVFTQEELNNAAERALKMKVNLEQTLISKIID